MKLEMRRELCPQAFIRQLFAEMEDGKVSIEYEPFFEDPYTMTYEMDWTAEDADHLVQRYDDLTAALAHIGNHYEELQEEENRNQLLTQEQQAVWDIYIRPFDPFDGDLAEVAELELRSETDTLTEAEQALLDRHYQWYADNSLQRLPVVKCAPTRVINRARRYMRLISLNAPKILIAEEGRCLAEELALYYHMVQKPKPNLDKFIAAQEDTYAAALAEIRRGKKETHWRWFIFPQLRGLGQSTMSYTYGITDLAQAKAYLADAALGSRLKLITEELLKLGKRDAVEIFGQIDAMKLKSSMTLFACAEDNADSVFRQVLRQYFNGEPDARTIALLKDNCGTSSVLSLDCK